MAIARLIRAVAIAVALVIGAAILLGVLSANPHNVVVHDVHDAGSFLVGPFRDVFAVKGPKLHLALNWGLAAAIYLVVGTMIARVLARGAFARPFRRARPVV